MARVGPPRSVLSPSTVSPSPISLSISLPLRWFENLTGQEFWGNPGFLIYDPAGDLRAQQIGAAPRDLIDKFIAGNSPAGRVRILPSVLVTPAFLFFVIFVRGETRESVPRHTRCLGPE